MSKAALKKKIEFLKLLQNKNTGPILKHLDDESLYVLSEFLYNIVYNTLNMTKPQLRKVKNILLPYEKPITRVLKSNHNSVRKQAFNKLPPQFGGALATILATALPLLISLISRR